MTSKERFLKACRRESLDRPPVWVMRQAGRYLPEYRALKADHGFLEMVKTPELATEVTLQPVRRFKLDAAILFSDILVIPEALGQPYAFRETGGIEMAFSIDSRQRINALNLDGLPDRLDYVPRAIRLIQKELDGRQALIGFGGSPWTLATYMVEGGSSKTYSKIKTLYYERPDLFHQLLNKLTDAVIEYFKLQIAAGVDSLQIFDSWGGVLSASTFWPASGQYLAKIVAAVDGAVPVIVYSKEAHGWVDDLKRIKADVLGISWTASIGKFFDDQGGSSGVQGNLDPALMSTAPEIVRREAEKILDEVAGRPGHIFNLGHGIHPDARIECMEALVDTVTNYRRRT